MIQGDEGHDGASKKADAELTDADWEYIKKSDEQIARGEYVDFDDFAREMRRKFGVEPT